MFSINVTLQLASILSRHERLQADLALHSHRRNIRFQLTLRLLRGRLILTVARLVPFTSIGAFPHTTEKN